VRGFQERSLGPRVEFTGEGGIAGQNMLGGSRSAVFKLELRRQMAANFAISAFTDAGNVFFAESEIRSFYETQNRSGLGATSTITGNTSYSFSDLITNPEYIWKKNYISYGAALNYLTPLGAVNFAWGIPWKRTIKGGDQTPRGRRYGDIHLNIGTTF
jgi:outer membrane protein assembly factor BamA